LSTSSDIALRTCNAHVPFWQVDSELQYPQPYVLAPAKPQGAYSPGYRRVPPRRLESSFKFRGGEDVVRRGRVQGEGASKF